MKRTESSRKLKSAGTDIELGRQSSSLLLETEMKISDKASPTEFGGIFGLIGRVKSTVSGIFTPKKEAFLGEENRYHFNPKTQAWELRSSEFEEDNKNNIEVDDAPNSHDRLTSKVPSVQAKKRSKVLPKSSLSIAQEISSGASGTDCSEDEEALLPSSTTTVSANSFEGLVDDLFEPGKGTLMMISIFSALKVIVIGSIELFPIYLYLVLSERNISTYPGEIGMIFFVSSLTTVVYQLVCSRIIDMKGKLFAQHIAFQTAICLILSLSLMIFYIRGCKTFSLTKGIVCAMCACIWFAAYSWIQLVTQFLSKLKSEYRNGINMLFIFAELLGGFVNMIIIAYSFKTDGIFYTFSPYYSFLIFLIPLAFLAWDMIRGRIGLVRHRRGYAPN